jgi:hypothetical protein
MQFARSGMAVAIGFAIFSGLFAVIGPSLGAVLTTIAAGVMAGYLTAKIARNREMVHGGATAGLVAVSLVPQSVLTLPARLLVAAIAVAAISGGAWVRAQSRILRDDTVGERDQSRLRPHPQGEDLSRRSPQGEGGEGRL